MIPLLQVLARGAVMLVLYGLLLAALHRLTGVDEADHRLRRRVRRLQTLAFLFVTAAVLLEALLYLRRALADGDVASWAGVLAGFGAPAVLTWLALLAPAGLAAWYVACRQAPACRALAREAELAIESPAAACDGNVLQDWDRRLAEAAGRMPLLAARHLDPVRRRLREAQQVGPDVHRDRARAALRRGQPEEALKHLLRCDTDSLEVLLLASDCRAWSTAYRLMDRSGPRMPRLEAAQLMAEDAGSEGHVHLALEWLGGREGSRRRAAAIEYHRGKKAEARRLLSGDWEARVWVKDDLSNSAIQT